MRKHKINVGMIILLIALTSEILLPFILSTQFPVYNHATMLISEFGEVGSPVARFFNMGMIINGMLFLLAIPSVFNRFKQTNKSLSIALSIMIGLYALGDCILTGVFARSSTGEALTIGQQIHDYASGVGFVALLIGIAILISLYRIESNKPIEKLLEVLLIVSFIFMIIYSNKRLPILNVLDIPFRGLWQRLNLFAMYAPYIILAIESIKHREGV